MEGAGSRHALIFPFSPERIENRVKIDKIIAKKTTKSDGS